MTSASSASEIERLKQAAAKAEEKHAQQMALLNDITTTAAELEELSGRWNAQLAALANLSGGAAGAAEISGLPRAQIEAAIKTTPPEVVKATAEASAAAPTRRRRRRSTAPRSGATQPAAGA